MAFLGENNQQISVQAELDLFKGYTNQVAIEKIYYAESRPISNIHGEVVEFNLTEQGPKYIDLKRSRLFVKARIMKADGTTLAKDEKTSIINFTLEIHVVTNRCFHE